VNEVLGSANRDDAGSSAASAAGAEDVVGVLLFDDDGIVNVLDVAREFENFGVFGCGRGGEGAGEEQGGGADHADDGFPKL